MKRRSFLQTVGLLAAGGAATGGRVYPLDADSKPQDQQSREGRPKRNVLITSAHSARAQAIAAELSQGYRVRLTAPSNVLTSNEFIRCSLDCDEATDAVVRGMDAVIHVAEPLPKANEAERIDYRTRCTYNLLQAAVREGARQIVYLSSVAMMTTYDDGFEVDEDWRPFPTAESGALSHFLGEVTCREFAREGKLDVVVLRLGNVVRAETAAGKAFDPLWVDQRDVTQAVSLVLESPAVENDSGLGRWSVFHILSASPRARFSVARAKRALKYGPRFNWNQ